MHFPLMFIMLLLLLSLLSSDYHTERQSSAGYQSNDHYSSGFCQQENQYFQHERSSHEQDGKFSFFFNCHNNTVHTVSLPFSVV